MLAVAAILVAALLDLLVEHAVLAGLLIVGPLLAAARLSPARTAAISALSIVLVLALAVAHAEMGAAQRVATSGVAAIGALLAIWIARLRATREAVARRLAAQHAVARVGAESRTLDEAAPRMLRAIGETLAWDLGSLWQLDREAGELRHVATWAAPGVDREAFRRASERSAFPPGVGLPGRVWDTGRAAWIVDVAADANFPRLEGARAAGLCSAFAFPLRARDAVVGVMEFFTRERRAPDAELLRMMETFGAQVGQYVQVKRAEQAVRDSEALKSAILASALDCVITLDHEGRIVEFNPAAERTFGFARADVVGREMGELLVPPALRERHREGLRRYLATGEGRILDRRLELSGRRADGSEFPVELTVTVIPGSDPPLFAGYLRDITDRVRAEQELRRSRDQLEAILGHLADGVTVQDPGGRLIYANRAAARTLGYDTVAQLLATPPAEVLARFEMYGEDGEPIDPGALPGRRALRGEQPEELLVRWLSRRSGEERWSVVKASPVRDGDGRVALAVNIFEDITEHKRSEAAQRFLAETGRALGASLDYEASLTVVAGLAVPGFADLCAIDLERPDGRLERLALVQDTAGGEPRLEEARRRYRPSEAPHVTHALRTGEAMLYRSVPDGLVREVVRDEDATASLLELGVCSAIVVPLPGLERALGTITFANTASGRRFDERDLALAEEVAHRAATAIENARVYGDRAHIAQTLQRSLLPPNLPAIPGLDLAARYRAAGEATDVGGDFYDVFEVAEGRWAVVIGDVCGKGAEAAAVTALARYTIRAVAIHEQRPAQVLLLLNEALLRQRSDRQFCTVAYAQVDVRDGVALDLACGGHPPPVIVRRDGSVVPAAPSGTLLGALEDPRIAEAHVELEAGETLLFYTDGLTEARIGDELLGYDRLADIARDVAGLDAVRAAEAIEQAVAGDARVSLRDDLALLVLRRGGPPGASGTTPTLAERGAELEVRLPASSDAVALARRALAPLAEHLDEDRFDDLRLLVSEVVTNAVRHGASDDADWIGLTVSRGGAGLRVQVTDPGPGFTRSTPGGNGNGVRHGGWGLVLVEQLAARWGVQRGERTTVWFEVDPRAVG